MNTLRCALLITLATTTASAETFHTRDALTLDAAVVADSQRGGYGVILRDDSASSLLPRWLAAATRVGLFDIEGIGGSGTIQFGLTVTPVRGGPYLGADVGWLVTSDDRMEDGGFRALMMSSLGVGWRRWGFHAGANLVFSDEAALGRSLMFTLGRSILTSESKVTRRWR